MLSRNKNKITVLENVTLSNKCSLSYNTDTNKCDIPENKKHVITITVSDDTPNLKKGDIISFTTSVSSSTKDVTDIYDSNKNNNNEDTINILTQDICDNKIYIIDAIEDKEVNSTKTKILTLSSYSENYEILYYYADEYNRVTDTKNKMVEKIPSEVPTIDDSFIG